MRKDLENILKTSKKLIGDISNVKELQSLKQQILGKKSDLQEALKGIKDLADAQKKELGAFANEVKKEISSLFSKKEEELQSKEDREKEWIDTTLPGKEKRVGHLHPISAFQYEAEKIFTHMGFQVLDGPELESDFFNFEALNIPKHHPARDSQDTFYIKDQHDLVMRTQTSNTQVRAMLEYGAPISAIVPGKVFRNEATDATHDHTFFQIEGFIVDENIAITHLIGVMKVFFESMFKEDIKIRLRPGHFPFVEPGFELDIGCIFCNQKGCSICKQTGWIEMLGCGMIHEHVLKAGGVDPKKYTGFAFGMGMNRLVMLKYGIDDIRLFHSGKLSFLNQF